RFRALTCCLSPGFNNAARSHPCAARRRRDSEEVLQLVSKLPCFSLTSEPATPKSRSGFRHSRRTDLAIRRDLRSKLEEPQGGNAPSNGDLGTVKFGKGEAGVVLVVKMPLVAEQAYRDRLSKEHPLLDILAPVDP